MSKKQCCGSGMFIPDPDFVHPGSRIRIPDSTTSPKEEGKIFCGHKYHKIVNNFIFEEIEKIFLAKTLRIIILSSEKFVNSYKKYEVWDPGSRTQGKKGTGSRIRIRNTVKKA